MSDKGPKFRRATTHDRDVYVSKATPASGIPETAWDDPTGQLEGEQLARVRSLRQPDDRIAKVEVRVDQLTTTVARMDGKIEAIHSFAVKADAERERRSQADALALERRRKHTIALISALGVSVAGIVAALAGVFS
jgi:hypothetical protein